MIGRQHIELIAPFGEGRAALRVRGCPARDVGRFKIVPTECVHLGVLQPTAGRFEVVGEEEVRFLPRFPLVAGTRYSLLVDGVEVTSATVPAPDAAAVTCVVAIYPSAGTVPLNLLKLYIHFSAPMSEGGAARAVHARRADDGQPLPGVLLPMEPELWDPARRRLTLLLDPGRIKRGLAPHAELGYPLQAGVPIVVGIDRSFRDASGWPLVSGAERTYAVGPALRQHVTASAWCVRAPSADSFEALGIDFDRPLDRALLEHSLMLLDADGRVMEGRPNIADGERGWSFIPVQRWRPNEVYRLVVDARLEDVAGNSLVRVFDRDLTRPEDTPIDLHRAVVDFQPTNPAR